MTFDVQKMQSNQTQIIHFPKIVDARGNLTFIQNEAQFPFRIQRTFWTYNVPGGETRGGHAYKEQQELIIALSGAFDVIITDQNGQCTCYSLNRSYYGLYVPPLTWRHMENFSTNALSLHLSSELFAGDDYIRDFNEYTRLVTN